MASAQRVQIVTDSTSDIPQELAAAAGIWIVPLNITFGAETLKDRVDIGPDEFYERLRHAAALPRTSAPSPGAFIETYRQATMLDRSVLSIHISAKLSGTYGAARIAAGEFGDDQVMVVDSRQASMGLGWIALLAAERAKTGASLEELREYVNGLLPRVTIYVLLDTLENLRRGGRIGRASALLGTMLKVKPIITVSKGEVTPVEKVRLFARATTRLVEMARANAPLERLAVAYTDVPEVASRIRSQLQEALPSTDPLVFQAGPVIGTYVGHGAVAVMFVRAI
jgi:DegV family protein with EDD domain